MLAASGVVIVAIACTVIGLVGGFWLGMGWRAAEGEDLVDERSRACAAYRAMLDYLECEPTSQWLKAHGLSSHIGFELVRTEGKLKRLRERLRGVERGTQIEVRAAVGRVCGGH